MLAVLRNPETDEVKRVKIGWSWVLFLCCGFLGLPLFRRRLYVWGCIFLALSLAEFFVSDFAETVVVSCCMLGLTIWLGAKGNEMTARNYLAKGWVFEHPDSEATRTAMRAWGFGGGDTAPPVRRRRSGIGTKTCPDCDEPVARETAMCPVCRYEFADDEVRTA